MQKIRWFLLILGIALALVITVQNNDLVEVELFTMQRELPLSVLMLATGGVGFLLGALMTALMLRKKKAAVKAAKKASKAEAAKPTESSPLTPEA
ncbi:MAG: LapA family protein [Rubripirellula sp.]